MRTSFIVLFIYVFFLSASAVGQAAEKKEPIVSTSLIYGANSARITLLGERQEARVSSFFGAELGYHLKNSFFISGMALYAPKTSRFSGATIVKKNSLDFIIAPTYKVDDLTFMGGISIEQVSPASSRNITSTTVKAPVDEEPSGTDINAFFSAEISASKRINFFVQASIPTTRRANSAVGIGLKYKMNRNWEKEMSYRERAKREAKRQIRNLREGVLLVRLKTSKNKIAALQKVGLEKKALKVEEEQRNQNIRIVSAFRKNYTFSEVQFFYSHHTYSVKRKRVEHIFLDNSLQVDSSISIGKKPFLIAEYSEIEKDTARYYSHTDLEVVGNFQTKAVDRYNNGSTNFGFLALVVKNENFDQMVEPFPYYSRYNDEGLINRPERILFGLPLIYKLSTFSFDRAVKKMDKQLFKFYLKNK